MPLHLPPRTQSYAGLPRRVGVELEFGSLGTREAAVIVQAVFGGSLLEVDPHSFAVDAPAGRFAIALDSSLAHPKETEARDARSWIGGVVALVVPCEITCPPLPLSEFARLDETVMRLRERGAAGTNANPAYAFSAQLNPDIATTERTWLAAMLKAYLLQSEKLRAEIRPTFLRRILSFASRFPSAYVGRVLSPGYWPSLKELADDYLNANSTRNRELDLLPLLAWLDGPGVRSRLPGEKILPRPAFHYRLPNSCVDDANWTLTAEWNRWCRVEELAEAMCESLRRETGSYCALGDEALPGVLSAPTSGKT